GFESSQAHRALACGARCAAAPITADAVVRASKAVQEHAPDGGDAVPSSNRVSMAAKGALTAKRRFAGLGDPRARAIAAAVGGLLVVAAFTVPLRNWDNGNAVLAAFGIVVAAAAGAVGGSVAGMLVG